MNRKFEIINLITSFFMPAGIIVGGILLYEATMSEKVITIGGINIVTLLFVFFMAGIISIPIYIQNLRGWK